jgi:secondary thiamine-phosphate synthase enzyme
MLTQKEFTLPEFKRGFHLITGIIERNLPDLPVIGQLNIFIKHTSAALTINENADPSVRYDFNNFVNKLVPDGDSLYTHTLEGDDDLPAHIKSSIFGQSINIPISHHRLNLGTWQGIYLCEFRDSGGARNIVLTLIGN